MIFSSTRPRLQEALRTGSLADVEKSLAHVPWTPDALGSLLHRELIVESECRTEGNWSRRYPSARPRADFVARMQLLLAAGAYPPNCPDRAKVSLMGAVLTCVHADLTGEWQDFALELLRRNPSLLFDHATSPPYFDLGASQAPPVYRSLPWKFMPRDDAQGVGANFFLTSALRFLPVETIAEIVPEKLVSAAWPNTLDLGVWFASLPHAVLTPSFLLRPSMSTTQILRRLMDARAPGRTATWWVDEYRCWHAAGLAKDFMSSAMDFHWVKSDKLSLAFTPAMVELRRMGELSDENLESLVVWLGASLLRRQDFDVLVKHAMLPARWLSEGLPSELKTIWAAETFMFCQGAVEASTLKKAHAAMAVVRPAVKGM